MSENKHTPEPWRTDAECGFPQDIHDSKGNLFLRCGSDFDNEIYGEANASRIVVCVNACAGIDTELLEIIEDNDKTLAGVIANVEKQRDELLAALEFYAERHHFILHDVNAWETVSGEPQNFQEDEANTATVEDGSVAKAAISRVKGEQ